MPCRQKWNEFSFSERCKKRERDKAKRKTATQKKNYVCSVPTTNIHIPKQTYTPMLNHAHTATYIHQRSVSLFYVEHKIDKQFVVHSVFFFLLVVRSFHLIILWFVEIVLYPYWAILKRRNKISPKCVFPRFSR